MIQTEEQLREELLTIVAHKMAVAARTAPKACGFDNLEIKVITGGEIVALSSRMKELGVSMDKSFFIRDAGNIEISSAIVLIGTKHVIQGLNCGLCGFATCAEKEKASAKIPCIFNIHDLGLAIGSAVSLAADNRVDNRVMYSVGVAAMDLGYMDGCTAVMAIPIASVGKNPFFDRK